MRDLGVVVIRLFEMRKRRGHEQFGFASIFDYAAERFKTLSKCAAA